MFIDKQLHVEAFMIGITFILFCQCIPCLEASLLVQERLLRPNLIYSNDFALTVIVIEGFEEFIDIK